MENITLRSHIGTEGNLSLNIPTRLTNTDLEITVWLRPIKASKRVGREPFSQWWAKQLTTMPTHNHATQDDLRFNYLAERYKL